VTPPAARAGYAYLEGTLTTSYDSQAAYTTIDRVRSAVHAVPGANAEIGGTTAISLDVNRASAHDRNLVIPLILVVVFVILGLLLRALVAPFDPDRHGGGAVQALLVHTLRRTLRVYVERGHDRAGRLSCLPECLTERDADDGQTTA
jgi:hypothetical protein